MRRLALAALLLLGSLSAALPQEGFPVGNATVNGVDQTTAWSTTSPTPTCVAGSATFGTTNVRTKTMGKTVFVAITVTVTTTSTCATAVQVTMPFTVISATGSCVLAGRAGAVSAKMLQGSIPAGTAVLSIQNYDSTYPGANGERLDLSGVCEAA